MGFKIERKWRKTYGIKEKAGNRHEGHSAC